jgi:O-antigen/teichoic acid export membrane protein
MLGEISQTERVVRNMSVLMASQAITWLLTLLLTLFLPRYLGARGVGQLHLAESLWSMAAVLATFGMDYLVTKYSAREPERATTLLGNSLTLRLLLFAAVTLLFAVGLRFANYAPTTVSVIIVVGFSHILWQLADVFQASLRGLERMEYISLGSIVGKALYTVAGITLLFLGYGVLVIAFIGVVSAFLTAIIQGYFLRRFVAIRPQFDKETIQWMATAAVPYFFNAIFLVAYMQLDVIFISLMVNETVVGWYSAADRLFGTLLFIPTVISTALFPAIARQFSKGPEQMPAILGHGLNLMLLIGLPLGTGLFVVAGPLVILLFGAEFEPSGPVLSVLGLVLIMTYLNIFLAYYFISTDRQRTWTFIMVAATLATIPLDLFLVPLCQRLFGNGALGGALAFTVTELGILVTALFLVREHWATRQNVWRSARVFFAALIMMGFVWAVRDAFVLIPILVGAAVYSFLLWPLGLLPQTEIALIKNMVRQLLGRKALGSAEV